MNPTPKRHWFRFRLRTLFAVTTVIAIYLGWQASIVHERNALIAEGEARGLWRGINWDEPPWWPIRNLMGDRSYDMILTFRGVSPEEGVSPKEWARLESVFSEAIIGISPWRATGPDNLEPLDET